MIVNNNTAGGGVGQPPANQASLLLSGASG